MNGSRNDDWPWCRLHLLGSGSRAKYRWYSKLVGGSRSLGLASCYSRRSCDGLERAHGLGRPRGVSEISLLKRSPPPPQVTSTPKDPQASQRYLLALFRVSAECPKLARYILIHSLSSLSLITRSRFKVSLIQDIITGNNANISAQFRASGFML